MSISLPCENPEGKLILSYSATLEPKSPLPKNGDYLINLTSLDLYQYLTDESTETEGETGTYEEPTGGWTGPIQTLTWNNQSNFTDALDEVLTVKASDNGMGMAYMVDCSVMYTVNPTASHFKIDGPTGSEYNTKAANRIESSLFRNHNSGATNYTVLKPTINCNYIIMAGPLATPSSAPTDIPINYK